MKADEAPETYPIQFKDKIDEYLWKEHHIIGGCCSSIESLKYAVAREVAEKLTGAFIEKACSWLKENCKDYIIVDIDNKYEGIDGLFLDEFRNYMKREVGDATAKNSNIMH